MNTRLNTICGIAAIVLLSGCATSPGYSPPPERRAGEQCPMGETWICKDRYGSRLERESEVAQICYCESLHRVR